MARALEEFDQAWCIPENRDLLSRVIVSLAGPGGRLRRFLEAWASGADAVIDPTLATFLVDYESVCLDDTRGEAPHAHISKEIARSPATVIAACGAMARLTQNLA